MAIPKLLNLMRHAVQDTGDTLTGDLNFSGTKTVTNLKAPADGADATTKTYVDNINTALTSSIGGVSSSVSTLSNTVNNLDLGVTTVNGDKGAITNVAKTTGSTYTGSLIVNGASTLTTGQARNIYCSTSEPTSAQGNVGDIWIVYKT